MRRIDVIILALFLSLLLFASLYLLLKYDNAIEQAINDAATTKVSDILADRQTLKVICAK